MRDVATGDIINTTVNNIPNDIAKARLLVCDDLVDGGRTFIELAKVLKPHNPKEMALYVTHGIFSKGKFCLLRQEGLVEYTGFYDHVWSTVDFRKIEK